MRKQAITRRTAETVVTKKRHSWQNYLLMVICTCLLVGGLFMAGRLHFASMDYGIKNSRMRKQIEDLEAEKRRLLLQREIALSPMEIKKAVNRLPAFKKPIEGTPELAAAKKDPGTPAGTDPKPLVVKTVAVSATSVPATPALARSVKNARTNKAASVAE